MSWDPFQRDVLVELGHVLYRQAGTGMASPGIDGARMAAVPGEAATAERRMLVQLARAARMPVDVLCTRLEGLDAIEHLRGDAAAAAKRTLWPRLRALRRQG